MQILIISLIIYLVSMISIFSFLKFFDKSDEYDIFDLLGTFIPVANTIILCMFILWGLGYVLKYYITDEKIKKLATKIFK